jgi:rhamnosyltransferase subunit B
MAANLPSRPKKVHYFDTMAKILISTFGSFGDVDPYLGLAVALKERGHRPAIATAEYYRAYIEGEGVDFHPLRPHIDPSDREALTRIMDPRRGTEYLLREMLFPTIRDSYEDLLAASDGTDLLVSHPLTYSAPIVAEVRGIRWISTALAPISFFSRYDAPVIPPAPGLKRLERLIPPLGPVVASLARLVSRRWAEPIHALRRELSLPRDPDPIFAGQLSGEIVLALFSRVLARPQPDWPANVRIVGNIFHDRGRGGLNAELERFLADGPPPVVFTLGSAAVHVAGDFYEQSAEAIRRLGKRAVLLLGDDRVGDARKLLAPGIFATGSAPYHLLLPRAAAVVHHGGIGTTVQTLRAGKPALIVPFAHDQQDNAFRVEALGAARALPLSAFRARRVTAELTALFGRSSYSLRAAEVGSVVRGEDGAATAADEIDARLAIPSSTG